MKTVTTQTIRNKKKNNEIITMLTAYDYPTAAILDEAGIDIILVGDSLGMVILGYENTTEVTIEDMLHHVKAVSRGSKHSLIVADLPFLTYHTGKYEAVRNAGRLVQEGKANAVKLEGGTEVIKQTKAIINAGIPVMGHIGLTPQSINQLGGYYIQGKSEEKAKKLLEDAMALEEAGAFAIVLECIPTELARLITEKVEIPTIGIGAGSDCDGQVLVTNDILNLYSNMVPKFVKQYANLQDEIMKATSNYIRDVEQKAFPSKEHVFHIKQDVIDSIYGGGKKS
ncbi:3-methyl-2-oxobutanoate hydroxymethyltransferase [Vallitalea guaymasensis]|uniref:3-methyl-2-oxobutanoate hydroxymethyltransferase n=1 Tax=Vallitalea guaymasensis TaxID=1185412 RepID=A0A8J8SE34_9FIRM|nr:3-methyl-2-oxobutanoate hydroxymethyltransferase [Vallitalea guaymasensis]QUH31329.1 3-methyl-2-oxobutanoate hydroxymethyltransferase [Vallitalea guaymasensis]